MGRPKKKDGEVVTTNIRVTKDTHRLIKAVADKYGLGLSETIEAIIRQAEPNIEEEIREREDRRKALLRGRDETKH